MEEERAGHVRRRGELHEGAVLAARVRLLRHGRVARAFERVLRVALHGRLEDAVVPGREAVLLLGAVDHLAARQGGGGAGEEHHDRDDGERSHEDLQDGAGACGAAGERIADAG